MTARPVIVTDHALLRWLERVEGFDVEGLRVRIAGFAATGVAHGSKSVIAGRGKLLLRDATVVTVLHRTDVRYDLLGARADQTPDAAVSAWREAARQAEKRKRTRRRR